VKILWLKTELLHPIDKGGKIRTYHMLKRLKRDHEITYLALSSEGDSIEALDRATEYCHRVLTVPWSASQKRSLRFYGDLLRNVASPLPYAVQKYHSLKMRQMIERELGKGRYDLLVCDFLAPSLNLPGLSGCASLLFQHNVEAAIWRRHHETASGRLKKLYFYSQWRKMRVYEEAACRKFDAVVAVSTADRDAMRDDYGLPHVYDVPTGVDTDYYKPLSEARDPFGLVFTGSMDWLPNEDAILYFAKRVLPRVAAVFPQVSLTVVGRSPTQQLLDLALSNPRIKVTGRVDDTRPYVDAAAAYVVPIRIGGGTRLKIYEAMSMARPVISTSIGAEGLPLRNGEDLLIADGPGEFGEAVIRVLADPGFAARIGERSRRVVCEQFDWDRAATAFARAAEAAVRRRGSNFEKSDRCDS
jgi:glycosyltransferase involved in cell wall biosynthesis